MRKIRLLWLFFILSSVGMYAQEENLSEKKGQVWEDFLREFEAQNVQPFSSQYQSLEGLLTPFSTKITMPETDFSKFKIPKPDLQLPYRINPSPMFYGDYSTGGQLLPHLYGSGSQSSLPGIGRMNDASLRFSYPINEKFEISAGVGVSKYNFPFSAGQTFGVSGMFLYRPTDDWSVKLFGSYTPNYAYNLYSTSYGAAVKHKFTDKFSLEAGVQRVYNPMTGKWETIPIVSPYFNIKGVTVGLDVGGILYGILQSVLQNKRESQSGGGNPTIMPGFSHRPIPVR